MSGIVLSSSVRQNLLSLQSTADLLATTQNRLATGKKVNTALDNPTNFFTAQSLDSRAGDINNLLDGIGNGVQVLQAANTGITSLQKLVDTAKSIANQALQSAVGYSTKSNVVSDDRRRHRDRPARHHDLYQRDRVLERAVLRCGRRHHGGRFGARRSVGVSASLAGTAATAGDGTHGAYRRHHPDRGHGHQRDRLVGQCPADRWPDLDGQRQHDHLQVGLGPGWTRLSPPAPASSATSSPTAMATLRFTSGPPARRHGTVGDLLTAIDLASGVQTAVIDTTTGVAAFSNASGTNAVDRRLVSSP